MQRPPWKPMYLERSMIDADGANGADDSDSEDALLYRRHASIIFAYLRLHTSTREDAEDLLEEVFLAALERDTPMKIFHEAMTVEEEQRAWLRSVARNKLVDFYRRSNRHPALALEEVAETLTDDEELIPEQVALRHEAHAHLRTVVKSMPALQQEILRLRFSCGLRSAEIATVLNKRPGAVRMLLSRTLNLLRSLYEKQ